MFNLKKNKKGFTLVELMVVVVIIGILTAIAIPVYNSVTASAKVKSSLANQRTIDSAIEAYYANNNKWPEKLQDLIPNYIAEAPIDPFGASYVLGLIAQAAVTDENDAIISPEANAYVCSVIGDNNFPSSAILHNGATAQATTTGFSS